MTIWFATGNVHKKTEIAAIFNAEKTDGYTVLTPVDAGMEFDPVETGISFHENALLKANALYRLLETFRPALYHSGDPVIADDSGICVEALGGRPGIYSARYAGAGGGSIGKKLEAAERNALLLEELGDNPNRRARFVCAMAVLFGTERFAAVQETLEGELIKTMEAGRGGCGFGYDPIFVLPELQLTLAELSEAEKNRVSHRGKAGRLIAAILRNGN